LDCWNPENFSLLYLGFFETGELLLIALLVYFCSYIHLIRRLKASNPQSHYCFQAITLAAALSMAHCSADGRPLLPKPYESLPEAAGSIIIEALFSIAFAIPVVAPSRKPKTCTKTSSEWEEQADSIRELYEIKNMPLEAVIRTLEEQLGFQASLVTAMIFSYDHPNSKTEIIHPQQVAIHDQIQGVRFRKEHRGDGYAGYCA